MFAKNRWDIYDEDGRMIDGPKAASAIGSWERGNARHQRIIAEIDALVDEMDRCSLRSALLIALSQNPKELPKP